MRGRNLVFALGLLLLLLWGFVESSRIRSVFAPVGPTVTALPVIDLGTGETNVVGNGSSYTPPPTPTTVSPVLIDQAGAAQQVLINVYQRVNPSVVNIDVALSGDSSS